MTDQKQHIDLIYLYNKELDMTVILIFIIVNVAFLVVGVQAFKQSYEQCFEWLTRYTDHRPERVLIPKRMNTWVLSLVLYIAVVGFTNTVLALKLL